MGEIDPEDAKVTLRFLRAIDEISQAELAERAGLEERSVRRYEAGQPISLETLAQLAEAAGVSERTLTTLLLPLARYLRVSTRPAPESDPGATDRELVEEAAGRAGDASSAATRAAFLRAWAQHVQETLERDANAWRPQPNDREVGLDLWSRMNPLLPAEREILLRHGTDFHNWALAEKVADLALETLRADPARATEQAGLALRVANLVPGSEAWKARLRAYVLAAFGRVQTATGDAESGAEARAEAKRLWAVGAPEPGPLSEEKFRAALAG